MKISVICPTYNRNEYLENAINSFLLQDYSEKEMIIVNDGGSKPNGYLANCINNQIRYFDISHKGQAGAQNFGVEQAKGELICTLDDDDEFYDRYSLSKRVELFLANSDLEFLWSSCVETNERMEITKEFHCQKMNYFDIWKRDYNMAINSIMFKKNIKFKLSGYYFDEGLTSNEDWDFKIRCLIHCKSTFLDYFTCKHRVYGGMRSNEHRQTGELQKNESIMREKLKILYGGLFD